MILMDYDGGLLHLVCLTAKRMNEWVPCMAAIFAFFVGSESDLCGHRHSSRSKFKSGTNDHPVLRESGSVPGGCGNTMHNVIFEVLRAFFN